MCVECAMVISNNERVKNTGSDGEWRGKESNDARCTRRSYWDENEMKSVRCLEGR